MDVEQAQRVQPGDVVAYRKARRRVVAVSHDGGKHFDPASLVVAGLFIDPPSVTVDGQGRIGLAFSSSDAALEDREVLFVRVGA